MPWRVDHGQRTLLHDGLVERAAMPAGVRLTFHSNSTLLRGHFSGAEDEAVIDLCCDGELLASASLRGSNQFQFDGLPPTDKLIELWLPQFGQFRIHSLAIERDASFAPFEDTRPRWITYGSSITQCRAAPSPTQTWPALVARTYNLNLTCLGFGGQCHLDTMIARQIRDTAADYISLCIGINIYGNGSLNPRTFGPSILGFIQIVREKHPSTPLVLMSPIYSPGREETVNAAGLTLSQMRTEVEAAFHKLQAMGNDHLFYVNGLEILGPDQAHLLPDDLHPDAEGYRLMATRFGELVVERYFLRMVEDL